MVLEKTLESPLDCKEIQPVHPKGDKSWVFTGRTDAESETPMLCLPHAKSWLIGKDPDAGRDWGQEEKGMTEDEMLNGIIDSMGMSLTKLWEFVMDREAWCAVIRGVTKSQTPLSDWTELNWIDADVLKWPSWSTGKWGMSDLRNTLTLGNYQVCDRHLSYWMMSCSPCFNEDCILHKSFHCLILSSQKVPGT